VLQTTTILQPFFRDHPGEPVPEENFWTLWCKGRLTEADTDQPAGRHSIRTNQCPPPTILPLCYKVDKNRLQDETVLKYVKNCFRRFIRGWQSNALALFLSATLHNIARMLRHLALSESQDQFSINNHCTAGSSDVTPPINIRLHCSCRIDAQTCQWRWSLFNQRYKQGFNDSGRHVNTAVWPQARDATVSLCQQGNPLISS